MAFTITRRLSPLEDVQKELPLSDSSHAFVQQSREELKAILRGDDDRMVLILGPCSAWCSDAVIEYAKKLKPLADKVSDRMLIIMRCYTQKPRTVTGWTGPFMEPDPHTEPDVQAGILACRDMMLRILDIGLPLADELLYPAMEQFLRDCLCWGAIGARSSENQEHRILTSFLDYPVGIKNPTSGDIVKGINAIRASVARHHFGVNDMQIYTDGNPFAHLILRGGGGRSNYDCRSIMTAIEAYAPHDLPHPAILIDASHENSFNAQGVKDPARQAKVIQDVIQCRREHPKIANFVKGFMVESFLKGGKQKLTKGEQHEYGQSITDACLGWEDTVKLVEELYTELG